MKLEQTLTPCIKINSKWLKDFNIRQDTIKLLKENIGKTFSDINHINIFLSHTPKVIEIKKINQWGLIKLTSFCTAKETIDKTKRYINLLIYVYTELLLNLQWNYVLIKA